jgi:hypothetical protein
MTEQTGDESWESLVEKQESLELEDLATRYSTRMKTRLDGTRARLTEDDARATSFRIIDASPSGEVQFRLPSRQSGNTGEAEEPRGAGALIRGHKQALERPPIPTTSEGHRGESDLGRGIGSNHLNFNTMSSSHDLPMPNSELPGGLINHGTALRRPSAPAHTSTMGPAETERGRERRLPVPNNRRSTSPGDGDEISRHLEIRRGSGGNPGFDDTRPRYPGVDLSRYDIRRSPQVGERSEHRRTRENSSVHPIYPGVDTSRYDTRGSTQVGDGSNPQNPGGDHTRPRYPGVDLSRYDIRRSPQVGERSEHRRTTENSSVHPIYPGVDTSRYDTRRSTQVGDGSDRRETRKYRKPANYDGTSNWTDYLVQFELVAEINRWNNDEKALELATCLRGVAQGVLSDLRPESRRSFEHLVSALNNRFQPDNQAELYRAQMKNRLRKRSEPLTDLGHEIKRLVRLAYPGAPLEVREHLARDCFIDSLNNSEMEWAVFQGKPATVDDAMRFAMEFEAFQTGRKRRIDGKADVRMQQEVTDTPPVDDLLQGMGARLAKLEMEVPTNPSFPHHNRPAPKPPAGRACYYCGEEDHFISRCEKRRRDMSQQPGNPQGRPTYPDRSRQAPKPMNRRSEN